MKKIFYLILVTVLFWGCKTEKAPVVTEYSSFLYDYKPMPMDSANSIQYKWDRKEILETKFIDGMESLDNWKLDALPNKQKSVAVISVSDEKVFEGKKSLKFVCPTKLPVQMPNGGRYWLTEHVSRVFKYEDFSEYNRVSMQIFPVFEGWQQLYLTLIIRNASNVPDKYNKSGRHTVQLRNNQWNKLVMEIPHLPHDSVTAISIRYALQGNEPGAADSIIFYADNLVLEKVDADYYEGWHTNNEISFTHSGYSSKDRKTAFSSSGYKGSFMLVDAETNEVVLEKDPVVQTSHAGTFSVFDFSEYKKPGTYRIAFGEAETQPFPINNDVWWPSFEKTINLLYVLRCGFEIPGIHQVCHTDWYTVFKGDTIEMSGGWHDAGDLSQSYARTAETTGVLFKLSREYSKSDPRLSARLRDEALWGLKWVHKNRFEGLPVLSWTTHDHYSDGIIGNFDDTPTQPGRRGAGIDNYFSIVANVEASLALEEIDPELSALSKQYALTDWNLLAQAKGRAGTEKYAMATLAGTRLYSITQNEDVKKLTIQYADSLISFQQAEPMNWTMPLNGFFYMNKGSDRIFGYPAGFSVVSPIIGLVEMCKQFPKDANYDKWFNSVKLHANYLKTIAGVTAPYYMIPANVYKLGAAEDGQILNGMKMDDQHYLRMFPVWTEHRGNNANLLSFGIGLAAANQLIKDPQMHDIARAQLEWIVGRNPFSQSLMYGEGYDFSPQYAAFPGDVTGGLPVGIQTRLDSDLPFWPACVLHNYKELWIHPSYRWLELLDYLGYI